MCIRDRDKAEELVALDATITDDLRAEGLYRDLLRNCQVLRREAGFRVDDRVRICVTTGAAELAAVVDAYRADIERETLSTLGEIDVPVMEKDVEIGDYAARLKIAK